MNGVRAKSNDIELLPRISTSDSSLRKTPFLIEQFYFNYSANFAAGGLPKTDRAIASG